MTTDPIKAAQEVAQQAVANRVNLVRRLVDARTTEDSVRILVAAAKDTASVADPALIDRVQAARAAADDLLQAAVHSTANARKAATDGGWSIDELRSLGVIKPAATRKKPAATSRPGAD